MKESVSITIPSALLAKLNKETKRRKTSRSEVVTDMLTRYMAVRDFYELRTKMVPKAKAQGIFTDEDVFEIVS